MTILHWLEDTFCDDDLIWDYNQLWNTTVPVFSRCLRKTIPVWVPAILLWLCAPIQTYMLWRAHRCSRSYPIALNFYNISRIVLVSLIILVNMIHLAYDFTNSLDHEGKLLHHNLTADLSSSLVNIFTFTLFIFLINLHRLTGHHTSALAWFFTFLNLIFSLPGIYMLSMYFWEKTIFEAHFAPFESYIYISHFTLFAVLFLFTCFADRKRELKDEDDDDQLDLEPYPETSASFFSKLTYWWFNPLARLGFKKSLKSEDLWDLMPHMKVKKLAARFYRNWQLRADSSGKFPGTMMVLLKTLGWSYAYACIFQLISVALTFISPQLLKLLIGFISDRDAPLWHGFFLAALLFIVFTVNSLAFVHFFRLILDVGTRADKTLMAAIYKKSLTLSSAARRHATSGQIVNLMSSDAKQFQYLTTSFDDVWAAPLQIILSTYFLWLELGPSALAGIGAMITIMPLNWWITKVEQRAVNKQMKIKDERVNVTNEVLSGIRVIKIYAWEIPFIEKINEIRQKETNQLKKIALLNALTSFVWNTAPFLVSFATFAVYVLSSSEHVLDAKKAFIALSLFEIMRYPLGALPSVINRLVLTATSLKRLNRYFSAANLDDYVHREMLATGDDIVIENATFSWGEAEPAVLPDEKEKKEDDQSSTSSESTAPINLSSINLRVKKGSLVAIVGQVGSGKSSLLSAILGEMELTEGNVNIVPDVSISYVSQQAWIQNATLRDNILFGSEYKESKYNQILQMCALMPDIEMLPSGDQTEIGEKGINLSGGQKQRVAIARACYAASDIVLFDDPLSAVDSHVAKHIFTHVLSNSTGYLQDKTRILVTNNIAVLPEVDHIIVLTKGQINEAGTYLELISNNGKFSEFISEHSTAIQKGDKSDAKADPEMDEQNLSEMKKDKLIEEEKAEEGNVKWSVYMNYFRSLHWFWLFTILIAWIFMQVATVGTDFWLALWSDDPPSTNATDSSIALRNRRLTVYGLLGIGQNVFYFIGWIALAIGSARSSIMLHRQLLDRIMKSPMNFFDTTPLGRIVNRFSKDMDTVDSYIRFNLEGWLCCLFRMISLIILIIVQIPVLFVVVFVVLILYYLIQRYYIATYRQLSRLESVTSSPIFSHFGETLSGMSTIRAFGHQERFIRESNRKVDTNQRTFWAMIMANRWLGVRMELCGNLIVLFAAIFAVLSKETFKDKPGFVGLIVTYAISTTVYLKWLVRNSCEMETSVVAVERIGEYCQLPTEGEWSRAVNRDPMLPDDWPEQGTISMEKYSVRYREGLEPVLKDICIDIKAGEKIGIVGRTGAGKSSLTLGLFRILEAAQGRILIDGIDISRIGLHELRSKLSIIPQDPVLFSGTIRSNLDPLQLNSDEQLWKALEHCHLKSMVTSLPSGLDAPVAENGSNLSVGERQLICLGRALLRGTRILVLDEATAAVDLETDSLVQATIAEHLGHCTILTIAHRLHTVRHADRVLALHQGTIAEFDTPDALLQDQNSIFYSLAKDAGIV